MMGIIFNLFLLACMVTMFFLCLFWIPPILFGYFLIRFLIQRRSRTQLPFLRTVGEDGRIPVTVGFFHPYCNAGGGGERVLWMAIKSLQSRYSHVRCVVYTGDKDASRDQILAKATQRFNIRLPRSGPSDIHFVYLHTRQAVEASYYPILTLLGQSLGSLILGMEALLKFIPDVYIDSMGYAFTLPLFRFLGGSRVACYVHYPTISTDMFHRVSTRMLAYNNQSVVSQSLLLSQAKLIYYKLFAVVYGFAGCSSSVIMVNSTWTYGHICDIWGSPEKTSIVYPPCDVQEFIKIPLKDDAYKKSHSIVSLGQFRPEKDHPLQIKSFAAFMKGVPNDERNKYKLILIGGCRDQADEMRVHNLRDLCSDLSITDYVEFRLNIPFQDVKDCLSDATIGLHTMWNEHFGIGVVECMAGGTIMLAHNSGGPKMDIVKDFNGEKTGFLADDVESYAEAMRRIFKLPPEERLRIRENARQFIVKFSDEEFRINFLASVGVLFE